MEIKDILDQIQADIYITDVDTDEILFMNKRMKEECGLIDPEGKKCWEVFRIDAKERCSFCKIPELLKEKAKESCIIWEEDNEKMGRSYKKYDSLLNWNGKLVHMQQAYDITKMLQLTVSASRDSLCCDVWNRGSGKEMLENRLKNLDKDQSCVLVLLDIDDLKQVNDYFGLSEGDRVLRDVCSYLNSQIEPEDFMFRLSGDEFVMVFFGKDVKEVSRDIRKWREKVAEWSNKKPYPISFSYGISYTNGQACTANELMDQADERMYAEKLRRRKNEILASKEEISFAANKAKIKMDYPAEYLYDALVRSTNDYVYVCNMKTGNFQYTPALVKDFNLPGEVVNGPMGYWKEIVHPDDWDRFYKANIEVMENKRDAHYVEFRVRQRNGEYVWIRCRGHVTRDEYGEAALFAGLMHRMGGQNKIDPLTQLPNHQMYIKRIKRNVDSVEKEEMAVMILDVDNFRQINEMYSRKIGDQVLCTLAHHIQALLPDNAALFRLDNDRMGLLASNSQETEMRKLFEEIQRTIRMMKAWKNYKLEIHFSAGCAFFPKNGKSVDELYQYADYALQYAKNQGKNRMIVFNEEILNQKSHRLELIRKLRDGMNHKFRGFFMNYQPQADSSTGEIIGVEALARFRDSEGSLISPAEFIPIMEEEGMIYGMGLWALQKSIQAAKKWIELKPDFSVSVNASALQMMEETYIEDVSRVLEEEKFPARNLVIELTESSAVQNLDIFRDKYQRLRKMGIRVAMDDFGTGYSSLEFLKNAPIDLVKIDRTFMRDILNSKFDSAFITFIVAICHDAYIQVCQEGVETREEYEFLKNKKLDCCQGYYFGKPMEEDVFTKKLRLSLDKPF